MDELQPGSEPETVADDTTNADFVEDRGYDTFDEAVEALADDESQDADAADGEEAEADEAEPVASVVLSDGTTLTLEEVEKGYLRVADYTRKTTEVAETKARLEAAQTGLMTQTQALQRTQQRLEEFVLKLIPAEPSASLAATNPGAFVRQQAERQAAIREIQSLLAVSQDIGAVANGVNDTSVKLRTDGANAELVKAMPALKDPARRAAFDKGVQEAAREFGFSDQELAASVDARVWRMAHFARIGMKAAENQRNAARRVDPVRKGAVPAPAPVKTSDQQALTRFKKEPTIRNASKLNF